MKYKQYKHSAWSKRAQITMIEKDITLASLAKETGYSVPHLRAVVNGRIISDIAIKKISDALCISDAQD